MNYEKLFSPIRINQCVLPNRIMMTAMTSSVCTEDGFVTDLAKERYRRHAKGGPGSIVVEAAVVLPAKSSFNLRISDDRFVPGLAELVKIMRAANPETKIGLQLVHFPKFSLKNSWRQTVEDFTSEDMKTIVKQFVEAAKRAVNVGFDFIEIHMTHSFTLACFLSLRNNRKDEYGGSSKGRMKLPIEVYQAVREQVGAGYPLGIRILGEEFITEGNTLLQSTAIAKEFARLGIDYISVSAGEKAEDEPPPSPDRPIHSHAGYSIWRMTPLWWAPDGANVYLAEGIRKAIRNSGFDVPVVTAGKIRTPDLAEGILEEGKADIIGLARVLLCDPDWPSKAREGRQADIVKCIACGNCMAVKRKVQHLTCVRWPEGNDNAPEPFMQSNARVMPVWSVVKGQTKAEGSGE